MNLKEGDKVLLPEYGGMKIELDGEEKFLYRESDILGKFQ
jgi:chaperonin GroES